MPETSLLATEQAAVSRPTASPGARSALWSRVTVPVALLVVLLLLWEYVPAALGVQSFIFPRFSEVIANFVEPDILALMGTSLLVTLQEAMIGLVIGAGAGILAGFALAEWAALRQALYPYLVAFQSLPKIAVAPLFVIWFGFDLTPKVLVVVMLTFFPLVVNTMAGITGVDRDRLDLFRSMCATRGQVWRKLLLPSALPSIFAGLEVAAVFSMLGAITGEFVSSKAGLGVLLLQQQANYYTAGVFAVLIVLAAVGVLFNQLVQLMRRRLLFWHAGSDGRAS
jgi:NitT/TauT family transport system permease protein